MTIFSYLCGLRMNKKAPQTDKMVILVPGQLENVSAKEVEEEVQKFNIDGDQNSILRISLAFWGFPKRMSKIRV